MNKNTNRVLGRILAVEETMTVSGAKETTPCRDKITAIVDNNADTIVGCEVSSANLSHEYDAARHAASFFKSSI
jgi:hypothetical protein